MQESFFWETADEDAPFGSDEGWTAYYEWHDWRAENPSAPLLDCFSWFLDGRLDEYNDSLLEDGQIAADIENPEKAFLADSFDMFTLDTTVIGTALGQLIDEGLIDAAAKSYVQVAVSRQLHPMVCQDEYRRQILVAIKRVIEAA